MDRQLFVSRLRQAAERSKSGALALVRHPLPERICFAIRTREVRPDPARDDGSEILAVEGHPPGLYLGPYTEEDVCRLLWREGRVPEWIDVSVCWVAEAYTLVQLHASYYYTEGKTLRHQTSGIPPFRIYGAQAPSGWESLAKSGQFDLTLRPPDGK